MDLETQQRISDRADELIDLWVSQGEAFTEGLCNAAINQAMRELGS